MCNRWRSSKFDDECAKLMIEQLDNAPLLIKNPPSVRKNSLSSSPTPRLRRIQQNAKQRAHTRCASANMANVRTWFGISGCQKVFKHVFGCFGQKVGGVVGGSVAEKSWGEEEDEEEEHKSRATNTRCWHDGAVTTRSC